MYLWEKEIVIKDGRNIVDIYIYILYASNTIINFNESVASKHLFGFTFNFCFIGF